MQQISGILKAGAVALQLCAALLWLMPQPVVAAPALLLPQVPAGLLRLDLSGGGLAVPQPGDAQLLLAQSTGGCGSNCPQQPSTGGTGSGSGSGSSGPQGITPAATQKFKDLFTEATGFCRALELRYRIDCLHAKFQMIAKQLPTTGDYAPLRTALIKATNRLEDVVDSFEDPAGAKIRPRLRSQPDAVRVHPLSPIRPEQQALANQVATEVVTELTTVLLRSGTNSDRQLLAFQEIATAIDSTKVLLRSA